MRNKNWWIVPVALIAGAAAGYVTVRMTDSNDSETYVYQDNMSAAARNVSISGEYPDFTYAAETAVNAVVYVKVLKRSGQPQAPSSLFEYFFGFGNTVPREQRL